MRLARGRFRWCGFFLAPGVVGMVMCPSDDVDVGTVGSRRKQAAETLSRLTFDSAAHSCSGIRRESAPIQSIAFL